MTPDDADRIFTGQGSDPLAAFVRDARDVFAVAPDRGTQTRHLAAMAEQFTAKQPAPVRRRRRLPVGRAAAAALAGSVLITGSALAATGHLPAPAQNAISDAARAVGLTLPSPHGKGDAGKARAAANKEAAKKFTDAKKAWVECENAQRGPSGPSGSTGPTGPSDCGAKPNPHDFRPEAPSQGDDHGNNKDNGNHGKPASVDEHDQSGRPPAGSLPTPSGENGHGNGVGHDNGAPGRGNN